MNIIFENIEINNFLAIQHAKFNLKNNGFVLINGINNNKDDNAKSNGAGKSALFEALIYCLTGETSRGAKDKDVVNKYTNDGLSIELNFKINHDSYKLIRYKEHKEFGTNLKLYINGIDKSGKGIRDTEKILSEYLPDLNSQLISSVIILGQGLPYRFTNNTPSGRKDLLEKLSKSDFMIIDLKDRLTKRKTILLNEIRTFEDNILADTNQKLVLEAQLQKLLDEKEKLVYEDFDLLINNKQIELDKLNTEFNDLQKKLDDIKLKLQICDSNISNLYKDEESKKIKIIQESNNDINPLYQELIKFEAERKSINEQVLKLESIKDICPTCGQKLPDVHKVDTTSLHNELDTLDEKIKLKRIDINNLKELANDKVTELEKEIEIKEKEINEEKLNISKEQSNINVYEVSDNIHKLEIEITTIKLNKENYETKSKTIDNDINVCKNTIDEKTKNILYNNIEKDNSNNHLDIINKMLNVISRDFRGYLLSNIIEYINIRAKLYSKDIFLTDKIDFKLDGNNIFIGYCNKAYEVLSGGEKQKVDLIVQFAIRDMMSQFLNFTSNIIVLDEIFDNLDYIGCQRVLDLISNKLNDLDSIFIITHHENELDIPVDKTITIIKDINGVSKLN